jgi:hypothetical protein
MSDLSSLVEGVEAAVCECGESAGDQLRDVVRAAGDGDQGALGQAVASAATAAGSLSRVRDVSVPAVTASWIAARERATSSSRYA